MVDNKRNRVLWFVMACNSDYRKGYFHMEGNRWAVAQGSRVTLKDLNRHWILKK